MGKAGRPRKGFEGAKAQEVRRLLEEGKTLARIRKAADLGYERLHEYLEALNFPKAFGLVRGMEAADIVGVHRATLYTYASAGRIQPVEGYGHPLFRIADVERLREELQVQRHERQRVKHGTANANRRGCGCEECVEAYRAYQRDCMRKLKKRKRPPTHGTASAYWNHGCRCDLCKLAGSMENKLARLRVKQRSQTA